MFKTVEEFQAFSKGQFDAATRSATAFSNSLQLLATETAEFTKKSMETGTDAMQKLMGTRSVESALQVQIDYAKSAYDSVVAEGSKIGGLMTAAAQDVFKPLEGAFADAQVAARSNVAA